MPPEPSSNISYRQLAPQAPQMLQELISSLGYPIFRENGNLRVPRDELAEFARDLSELVDKRPAWGWRYMRDVLNSKQAASAKLTRAIVEWGAILDGTPSVLANTEDVVVRAEAGQLHPGARVLASSQRCAHCRVAFVPRVPWQKYCSGDCRKEARKR